MIGSLIGAAGSLIGGLFGKKSAEKQAAQNIKMQKQFAQQGIQWKVEDAKKAGIHPLYALGAQTHSFSPVSVGDPLPGAIADMGQNIGRAVDSGRTTNERFATRLGELSVQRAELENTKLASEIALLQQPGTAPAPLTENPIVPGQAVTHTKPDQSVVLTGNPSQDPAINPELTLIRTKNGYSPAPSENFKKLTEDNLLLEVPWSLRNQILPSLGVSSQTTRPPKSWLPFGANTWKWEAGTMQWRPYNTHLHEYVPNSNFGGR